MVKPAHPPSSWAERCARRAGGCCRRGRAPSRQAARGVPAGAAGAVRAAAAFCLLCGEYPGSPVSMIKRSTWIKGATIDRCMTAAASILQRWDLVLGFRRIGRGVVVSRPVSWARRDVVEGWRHFCLAVFEVFEVFSPTFDRVSTQFQG